MVKKRGLFIVLEGLDCCGKDTQAELLRQTFKLAYLFAADRFDHLYNDRTGIFPHNKTGTTTIVPRYYFSSIAYNSSTPEQEELVRRLNQSFPEPDLTIYIDIPIKEAMKRLRSRSSRDIYEKESKLSEVRQNYEKIFSCYAGELLKVQGCEREEEISIKINKRVKEMLDSRR